MSVCATPNTAATQGAPLPAQTAQDAPCSPDTPVFVQRVSFDTFDNRDARDFSLALRVTHRSYCYTGRSRTFLCGIDHNEYSESALDWLIDVLVEDGDEIIALRVVDPGSRMAAGLSIQQKRYRKDADRVLQRILRNNNESKAVCASAVRRLHVLLTALTTPSPATYPQPLTPPTARCRLLLTTRSPSWSSSPSEKSRPLSSTAYAQTVCPGSPPDPGLPARLGCHWHPRQRTRHPEPASRVDLQVLPRNIASPSDCCPARPQARRGKVQAPGKPPAPLIYADPREVKQHLRPPDARPAPVEAACQGLSGDLCYTQIQASVCLSCAHCSPAPGECVPAARNVPGVWVLRTLDAAQPREALVAQPVLGQHARDRMAHNSGAALALHPVTHSPGLEAAGPPRVAGIYARKLAAVCTQQRTVGDNNIVADIGCHQQCRGQDTYLQGRRPACRLYLARNLEYLYRKDAAHDGQAVQHRRSVDSLVFEKAAADDGATWTVADRSARGTKKRGFAGAFSLSARLSVWRTDGQCVYEKDIGGSGRIDMLDNLQLKMEEPFRIARSIFRRTKGGIRVKRVCRGQLVFRMSDRVLMSGIGGAVEAPEGVFWGQRMVGGVEKAERGVERDFFYVTFDIPPEKTTRNLHVQYLSGEGVHRETEYVLNVCFLGGVQRDRKREEGPRISLRPKAVVKHQAGSGDEKVRVSYVFKAEENNEVVVRVSTREDLQCPWCRGRDFQTRQRLHFHFLMNHELFSFKLEAGRSNFLQFEIKLANEYPFRRISEQKVDFRVFQWIRHVRFKHDIENILSDNGKSVLFHNIMLGMDVEQNESVSVNIRPKRNTQVRWPSKNRIRRKFVAPNLNNLYKSGSKRKIIPGEVLSESEDDVDESWLIQKHEDILDDFMDITVSEKAFMKLWDRFIINDRPIGRCHLSDSVMRFVYSHKNILQTENLINEFWKHLLNLVQYKFIDLITLRESMEVVRNIHNEAGAN
ncbi:hypothetical protein PMAC_001916 [Pneumocystis sp. 'macacae']|nr:hypothetical protein PMAC_001916 [Pneumocystis sp. 'macacae']